LKLDYHEPLSNFSFNFNLRRYNKAQHAKASGGDDEEYHMTLSGIAVAGHSCYAPTAAGVIGAPRKAEISLMLRDLHGRASPPTTPPGQLRAACSGFPPA
jgi:hypothetical protein